MKKHSRCFFHAKPSWTRISIRDDTHKSRFFAVDFLFSDKLQAHAVLKTWNGTDYNWFNPSNWTPNGVPMAIDSVAIGTGLVLTIDPTISCTPIIVAALNIEDGGQLNTLPSAVIDITGIVTLNNGSINAQDSQINLGAYPSQQFIHWSV